MKPASQSQEALVNASIICKENSKPCSDQFRGSTRYRDCTQAPRGTQKAVTPCAYLLGGGRDTAQLKGSEPCGSVTFSFLYAKLDVLKVRQEGKKAMPILPSQCGAREARAWARTVRTSEVLKILRKRLVLGDPRYHQDAFAGGRRCHRDSSQGYPGACKRGQRWIRQ